MADESVIVGVSDHSGWAVLVTATGDGALLDRRRIALIDGRLPKLPHHHEAQGLPLDQAEDLIARVRRSAERHATMALAELATTVPSRIMGVALRECPPLPPTVAERLQNYRAQNVADTVMYRQAIAGAAEVRGWFVHWYQPKTVFDAARAALHVADLDAHFADLRTSIGPPWTMDHRLAMAAAIVAASHVPSRSCRSPIPPERMNG